MAKFTKKEIDQFVKKAKRLSKKSIPKLYELLGNALLDQEVEKNNKLDKKSKKK